MGYFLPSTIESLLEIMKDTYKYSDKEKELIEALGFTEIMQMFSPTQLYNIMTSACFVEQRTGLAVDSLRRCVLARMNDAVFRMTPEFDALIRL